MNTITNKQMVLLLVLTLTCYSIIVLPKEMAQTAGTGNWITLLAAALIFSIAAILIVSLNILFQGKMLFDYGPRLVGKPGTYVITIFYILYFMSVAVFFITMKAKLLKAEFMPNTPLWAFPLIGIPVFCYIAYKGISNVARLAEIIGIVFIVTLLFVHILMLTQGKVNRVLPLFNAQEASSYFYALKEAILPFMGIEVLLALPFAKANGKRARIAVFLTLIGIGLIYILVVESCIMKVGIHDIVYYGDPLIVAIRDTAPEFMDIFTRLDILYLTVGVGAIFIAISIFLTVIVEYLCKILKKTNRKAIVAVVGVLVYIQFYIFKDINTYIHDVEDSSIYFGFVATFLIPTVLFGIAKIKRIKVEGKKNVS